MYCYSILYNTWKACFYSLQLKGIVHPKIWSHCRLKSFQTFLLLNTKYYIWPTFHTAEYTTVATCQSCMNIFYGCIHTHILGIYSGDNRILEINTPIHFQDSQPYFQSSPAVWTEPDWTTSCLLPPFHQQEPVAKPKTINNGRPCVAIDVHCFGNLHRHPNTANQTCSCLAAISNMGSKVSVILFVTVTLPPAPDASGSFF